MHELFRPDSRLIRFLTRVCDLILLNAMLILSCMTIVFSGAAVTALYFVTLKMMGGEEDSIGKDFLRSLRDSFIPSVPATVLLFTDALLISVLHYALYAETLVFSPDLFVFLAIAAVFLTALLSYLFPLLARYENTFRRHLQNAARLAVIHLPVTFLLVAVNLFPLLAKIFFPAFLGGVIGFWLLIGAAAGAYLNSFYLLKIFQQRSPGL